MADAIVFVQPLGGDIVYLSDLPVAGYRHVPFLDTPWPYELDRSTAGSHLRAGGVMYPKGIGMHSASRLSWNLDRPYEKFEAEVAIDDEASGGGSVTFRVFVDRHEKLATPMVRGGEPPLPISVDLRGRQAAQPGGRLRRARRPARPRRLAQRPTGAGGTQKDRPRPQRKTKCQINRNRNTRRRENLCITAHWHGSSCC